MSYWKRNLLRRIHKCNERRRTMSCFFLLLFTSDVSHLNIVKVISHKRFCFLPIEDFVQVVLVLMLIAVVVQDEISFQVLAVLNVEDVLDVDIRDTPI